MAKYIDAEEDISGTNVENSGFISIQEALDANTVNITVIMMSSVIIGVIMSIWQEK